MNATIDLCTFSRAHLVRVSQPVRRKRQPVPSGRSGRRARYRSSGGRIRYRRQDNRTGPRLRLPNAYGSYSDLLSASRHESATADPSPERRRLCLESRALRATAPARQCQGAFTKSSDVRDLR